MNLLITLPEKWNPDCAKTVNRWFLKIERHVKKSKGL